MSFLPPLQEKRLGCTDRILPTIAQRFQADAVPRGLLEWSPGEPPRHEGEVFR